MVNSVDCSENNYWVTLIDFVFIQETSQVEGIYTQEKTIQNENLQEILVRPRRPKAADHAQLQGDS